MRQSAVRKESKLAWEAAADESSDPGMVEAWRECLAWMQREVDLCKRRAMPVVLLATPVDFQLSDESRTHAQRKLAEFAAANGIAYLDVLATLRERATAQTGAGDPQAWKAVWQRYFLDYDHFNPAGHELVAEMLAPVLAPIARARDLAR